jgi:hypothetical protein
MVVPSQESERISGAKNRSRGTSPETGFQGASPAGKSRRINNRPSDQDGRPERRTGAEGPLREWASQGASPAGKASTMNTYAIPKLNSFRMRTYAMRDFVKSFGMNTCAKWGGGRGHPVKSPAKSNPACPLSQTAPRLSASVSAPVRRMSLPRPPSDDAVYRDLRGRCIRFGLISSQTCDVTCLRKPFWCRSCLALP